MITKVIKKKSGKQTAEQGGSTTRGALSYLYGPGRAEEHQNPHLVASWDGLVADPAAATSPEVFALRLTQMAKELDRLVLIHSGRNHSARGGRLWHCAVRNAPADRMLTDGEWDQAARELVHAAGIAPKGDPAGCRWIAVRHASDHIHILATLRRMDGKLPRLGNDYLRLRRAALDLERRFELTPTPPVDWTASKRPTRGEHEKAQRLAPTGAERPDRGRQAVADALNVDHLMRPVPAMNTSGPLGSGPDGRDETDIAATTAQQVVQEQGDLDEPPTPTAREILEKRVRHVTAAAINEDGFFRGLRAAGLRVQSRSHEPPTPDGDGVRIGYAVHLPGDNDSAGHPIWYAGSALAPDLSLPRVQERWLSHLPDADTTATIARSADESRSEARARAWSQATDPLDQAAASFESGHEAHWAATAQAVGDLLTIAADRAPTHVQADLTAAAEEFERGARVPLRRKHNEVCSGLRLSTRAMDAAGQSLARGKEIAAVTGVIVAAEGALQAAVGWYKLRRFSAQAESAQRAIAHLRLAAWQLDPAHHAPDLRAARRRDFQQVVRSTLGDTADEVLGDPAYPTLATLMRRAERTGTDPHQMLRAAAVAVGLQLGGGVSPDVSLAGALAYRIQQDLTGSPQPPGLGERHASTLGADWSRNAAVARTAAWNWFYEQDVDLRGPELTAALRDGEQAGLAPARLLEGLDVRKDGSERDVSLALADVVQTRVRQHLRARARQDPEWARLEPRLSQGLQAHGVADTVHELYEPDMLKRLQRADAAGVDIAAVTHQAAHDYPRTPTTAGELRSYLRAHLTSTPTPAESDRFHIVLREALRGVSGAPSPDTILADPAWRAVNDRLRRAAQLGYRPEQVLTQAAKRRGFDSAESDAKVMAWRIDQQMMQDARWGNAASAKRDDRRPQRGASHRHRGTPPTRRRAPPSDPYQPEHRRSR